MIRPILFTTLFLVIVLLIGPSVATAPPPACMLACINKEPTPSDYKAVCGSSDVQSCLSSTCGGSKQAAIDFMKATCTSAGYKVAEAANSSNSAHNDVSKTSSGFMIGSTNAATTTGSSSANGATITSTEPASTNGGAQGQAGNSTASSVAFLGSLVIVLLTVAMLVL